MNSRKKRLASFLFTAVTVCGLGSAPAWALKNGDKPSLSFVSINGNDQVNLSDLAGKLVVVEFWMPYGSASTPEFTHMSEIQAHYSAKGLILLGVARDFDGSGTVKSLANQKGLNWPMAVDAKEAIAHDWGVTRTPYAFLIGPDGSVLWQGDPMRGLDDAIEQALKDHPPIFTNARTVAAATAALDAADKAIADSDLIAAAKAMAHFPAAASKEPTLLPRLTAVQKSLDELTGKALDEIELIIQQKQYAQAIAKLKDLADKCDGTSVAVKARARIVALAEDPTAHAAVAGSDRAMRADAALAAAEKLKADKKDQQAYGHFKAIVTEFAGLPAADAAAKEVKAYDDDPNFSKPAAPDSIDAKAKAALSMADGYKNAGKTDLARKKYQSVIDQFPNTPYADTAKAAIKTLED